MKLKLTTLLSLLFIVLLLTPLAFSLEGNMKLLAVSEDNDGNKQGSIANLNLKIVPGSGRVFIDTYPFSKIDTQISTRFAKEIACDFLEKDCSKLDFFYTINSQSYIIGGPSGSSAISALTVMLLDDVSYSPNVAITGTINSGGFIGPVAGIKEKIEAAAKNNITKVLIPVGTSMVTIKDTQNTMNKNINNTTDKDIHNVTIENGTNYTVTNYTNTTTDLIAFGKELNITVKEVSSLNNAVFEFSNKKYPEVTNIEVDSDYEETMKYLADTLCQKSKDLRNQILDHSISEINKIDDNLTKIENANNLTNKGFDAISEGHFYSGASFCFGANVRFQGLLVILNNDTDLDKLDKEIEVFDKEISKIGYKTITDLQAYMVVKERIKEAKDNVIEAYQQEDKNESFSAKYAYATERLYSARTWANFLGKEGQEFDFNQKQLEDACIKKTAEAEERFQYLNLIFPNMDNIRKDLNKARSDRHTKHFELCLFRAAKAKAQINTVLNFMGVLDVDNFIENKLHVTEINIAKKIEKNVFPIVGYSYLEYAKTLAKDDPYSSMLYGEYALELSDFEIYFKEYKTEDIKKSIIVSPENIIYFVSGILFGIIISLVFQRRKK